MAIKPKVTINDIAKAVNVTAATVSRALNNNPRISEATKKAVLKAAKELNYQPNNIAAALRHGKSHLIGVIVPRADRAFFSSVIRGIEEIANEINYKVIICQTYEDLEKESQTIETLVNARVDGIIASISKNTIDFSHYQSAIDKGFPVVLFDRTSDLVTVNQVVIDDYYGGYEITKHLIEQGCQKIAHLTSPIKINIYKDRLRGYMDCLADYGIPFDENLVIESNLQLQDGRASMEKLLAGKRVPDAVFSASDYGIMGALQVLKEKNIRVPEDVALAGFGNEPFTSFTDPTLTTVDQLSITMGRVTAELFFEQLKVSKKKHHEPHKTMLKPGIIVRQSSMKKKQEEARIVETKKKAI